MLEVLYRSRAIRGFTHRLNCSEFDRHTEHMRTGTARVPRYTRTYRLKHHSNHMCGCARSWVIVVIVWWFFLMRCDRWQRSDRPHSVLTQVWFRACCLPRQITKKCRRNACRSHSTHSHTRYNYGPNSIAEYQMSGLTISVSPNERLAHIPFHFVDRVCWCWLRRKKIVTFSFILIHDVGECDDRWICCRWWRNWDRHRYLRGLRSSSVEQVCGEDDPLLTLAPSIFAHAYVYFVDLSIVNAFVGDCQ